MMILKLVNKLNKKGNFLSKKINESILKYSIEFDKKRINRDSFAKLKKNHLLLDFIGSKNISIVEKEHIK